MVRHSFRQANKVAGFLSRLGFKLTPFEQSTILSNHPEHTMEIVKNDQQGVISTRLVLRTTCNKLAYFGDLAVIANYEKYVESNRIQNNIETNRSQGLVKIL